MMLTLENSRKLVQSISVIVHLVSVKVSVGIFKGHYFWADHLNSDMQALVHPWQKCIVYGCNYEKKQFLFEFFL